MELFFPRVEQQVTCRTCGTQTLPPYRLCLSGHVGCPPCAKYMKMCLCGDRFSVFPPLAFDCVIMAMKLRCRYGQMAGAGCGNGHGSESSDNSVDGGGNETDDESTGRGDIGGGAVLGHGGGGTLVSPERCGGGAGAASDCTNKWFDVDELREHYRNGCSRNTFLCPLNGCGHASRIDTVTEHYEAAHGPFADLTPQDDNETEVTFKIRQPTVQVEVVHKIFNGYFMMVVKPQLQCHRYQNSNPQLSIDNINPSDKLRYEYNVVMVSTRNDISVTVSLIRDF